MSDMTTGDKIFFGVTWVVLLYVGLALSVYSFSHPELTQTQVMINFMDAMRWR